MKFITSREIQIDAGHRVPEHESKCCYIHGHRYRVIARVSGALADEGSQTGMTIDFGFLKEVMMKAIDAPCDHGLILRKDDPFIKYLIAAAGRPWHDARLDGPNIYPKTEIFPPLKLYIVSFSPTAENLAKHWFDLIAPVVKHLTTNRAELAGIDVWETPNCCASFPG